MSDTPGAVLRLGDLRSRGATPFRYEPGPEARRDLARALGIVEVRSLSLTGRISPQGRDDWRLDGRLVARVLQECGVTLDPVAARIDEPVERLYVADLPELAEADMEMPDDAREPLRAAIDLAAVAAEALALALPPFPRAPGASLGRAAVTEPGAAPLTDADAKPFAGLAALRDRMDGDA